MTASVRPIHRPDPAQKAPACAEHDGAWPSVTAPNHRRFLPSTSLLLAFETCARLGQFTAAADELCLTQSAVSRQIRALEELIGVTLFARDRPTVRLTEAGEKYAEDIRDALRAISNATLRAKNSPGAGILHVAILPTIGTRWLAPLLPKFVQGHPGITLNLMTRLTPFDLDHDHVDAAIHYGLPDWPHAEHDFLFDEIAVLACSRELKQRFDFKTPADLVSAPLLHMSSRRTAWPEWFAGHHLVHTGSAMYIDQFSTLTQAATAGLGVALLPEFLFKSELDRGDLVVALDTRVKSAGSYYLACARSRLHHPPLGLFRQWIAAEAAISQQFMALP